VPVSHVVGARGSPLFHRAHWPWLRAVVGFNQFQSGFTKLCPLEIILKSAGVKQASTTNH
jgi:hypothetical protein